MHAYIQRVPSPRQIPQLVEQPSREWRRSSTQTCPEPHVRVERRPPSSSPSNILAAQMPRGHSSIFSSTFQALWLPNRYRAYQKWSTPSLNEQAESLCASPEAAPTQAQLTSSTDCCSERSRPPPAASRPYSCRSQEPHRRRRRRRISTSQGAGSWLRRTSPAGP